MRSRFLWKGTAAALIAIAMTGGCTTPHHSNALIFGTNTSFGIDIGQNATGTPTLVVGYRRQEAVFMPLVANAAFTQNGAPTPCSVQPRGIIIGSDGVTRPGSEGTATIPPCFLVGQNGDAVDSYSVLASFGAQFGANGTQTTASGGLAQFFATGLAAQALAIKGGSSLVAVGTAATVTGANPDSNGIAALYGAPAVTNRITAISAVTATSQTALRDYLLNYTTDQGFQQELAQLEQLAGHQGQLSNTICAGGTRLACIEALGAPGGVSILTINAVNWAAIVAQRKTARGLP